MGLAILLGIGTAVGIMLIIYGFVSSSGSGNAAARVRSLATSNFSEAFKSVNVDRFNRGRNFIETIKTSRPHQIKLFLAIFLGGVFFLGTRWPAAALFGVIVGWVGPDVSASFSQKKKSLAQIEAYESWVSQLAHLIRSGNHVVGALKLSLGGAPEAIKEDVSILIAQTEIIGSVPALDQFAERSRSPYADQIVLGLRVAYESGTKVAEVFNDLDDVFKNEIDITKRAESSRQLANTQILLSLGISFALVVLLVIINRGYLEPFDTLTGQVVMVIAASLFSGALFVVRQYSIVGIRSRLIVDKSYLEDDKKYQKNLKKEEKEKLRSAKKAQRKNKNLKLKEELVT